MDIKEYIYTKKRIEEFERREKEWIAISTTKDHVKCLPDICMIRPASDDGRDYLEYKLPYEIRERVRSAMLTELQKMDAEAHDKMKQV